MKKFKKIFAVLMTLAMVLGMGMTSFAAPEDAKTGDITVTNLKEGTTVQYSQILALDDEGNEWVFANNLTETAVGMSLTDLTNGSKVSEGAGINTNLKGLKLASLTYTGSAVADASGNATFESLPAGLYAVKAVDPTNEYVYSFMVAAIDYKNNAIEDANIVAKGKSNQVSKSVEDDKKSVSKGEEVNYKIEVAYPYLATTENASFEIKDIVNNGTIKTGTPTIAVAGAAEDAKTGLTATIGENDKANELTVSLNVADYNAALAGQTITVTYTVVAKADVVIDDLTNEVTSTVNTGNGPSSTVAKVILPTVKAEIMKVDEDGNAITNNSASFTLYEKVDPGTTGAIKIKDETGVEIDVVEFATADTDTTGKVVFTGLDAQKNGVYYVKETKAPEGFSVEEKAYPLNGASIGDAKTTTTDAVIENNVVKTPRTETTTYQNPQDFTSVMNGSMNFKNTNLASLPETGGIGTTIFTIGGCAIMIIAAALFFASRRKSAK